MSGFEGALVRAMAHRCGLQDPDTFAAKAAARWERVGLTDVRDPGRGTGRTTHMLLKALVALESGCTVEVVMTDESDAHLAKHRLGELMDAAAGDEPIRVWDVPRFRWGASALLSSGCDVVLVDHAVEIL